MSALQGLLVPNWEVRRTPVFTVNFFFHLQVVLRSSGTGLCADFHPRSYYASRQ
jgi:hypothetical protein